MARPERHSEPAQQRLVDRYLKPSLGFHEESSQDWSKFEHIRTWPAWNTLPALREKPPFYCSAIEWIRVGAGDERGKAILDNIEALFATAHGLLNHAGHLRDTQATWEEFYDLVWELQVARLLQQKKLAPSWQKAGPDLRARAPDGTWFQVECTTIRKHFGTLAYIQNLLTRINLELSQRWGCQAVFDLPRNVKDPLNRGMARPEGRDAFLDQLFRPLLDIVEGGDQPPELVRRARDEGHVGLTIPGAESPAMPDRCNEDAGRVPSFLLQRSDHQPIDFQNADGFSLIAAKDGDPSGLWRGTFQVQIDERLKQKERQCSTHEPCVVFINVNRTWTSVPTHAEFRSVRRECGQRGQALLPHRLDWLAFCCEEIEPFPSSPFSGCIPNNHPMLARLGPCWWPRGGRLESAFIEPPDGGAGPRAP